MLNRSKPILICGFLLLAGCSLDQDKSQSTIRAHDVMKGNVYHAEPVSKGTRYCIHCHGLNLQGGESGEPSCYSCHGENWEKNEADVRFAPEDHTVKNELFYHHPNLLTPMGTCSESTCHRSDLKGSAQDTIPSCYLCHAQNW